MSQVIVGKLQSTNTINVEGETTPQFIHAWDVRAQWAYVRLVRGYRQGDGEVKRDGLAEVFGWALASAGGSQERTLQFILDDALNVKAVATTNHLVTSPSEVYAITTKIAREMFGGMAELTFDPDLMGMSLTLKEIGNFRVGVQVFGGNILTRNAIIVASMMRVLSCFNPISWLRISEAARFTGLHVNAFEKVLRVKARTELEPRLMEALKIAKQRETHIEDALMNSKNISISESEARIILSAFGLSFSLGAQTVNQVQDRFLLEDQTMFGVSMAASYTANHGKLRKLRGVEMARQSLSTIAGAAILVDNVQDTVNKSVEWLKRRIVAGELKTVEDMLQGVKLP